MIQYFVYAALLLIVMSLGSGLFYLIRDPGDSDRTVRALTIRIALSLALFIFLIIAFALGWITPHGL